MNLDIGKIIKKGLQKKGKSQKWLASALDRNPSNISEWINNKKKPSSDTLIKLINLLDISEDFFPKKEVKTQSELNLESRIANLEAIVSMLLQNSGHASGEHSMNFHAKVGNAVNKVDGNSNIDNRD